METKNIKLILFICTIFIVSMNIVSAENKPNVFNKVYVVQNDAHLNAIQKKFLEVFKNSEVSTQKTIMRSGSIYFDTPELGLLNNDRQLRIQLNEYFSKKRKSKYHKNIEYLNNNSLLLSLKAKHYKSVKTLEGKHPLMRVIKRKERAFFTDFLRKDNFDEILRLKEVARLVRVSSIYQLNTKEHHIASISFDEIKLSAFGDEVSFFSINPKVEEVGVDVRYLDAISKSLLLALDSENVEVFNGEYEALHNQLKNKINNFDLLFQFPFLMRLLYPFIIGCISVFGIWIIFRIRQGKKY